MALEQRHRLHAELATFRRKVAATEQATADWLTRHPNRFVAWSGGKDGTVCAHIANQISPTPCAHYHTGLEFPEVDQHMNDLATQQGWQLTRHGDGDYLTHMVASGRWDHTSTANGPADLFHIVIGDPHNDAMRTYEATGWIWGLRADESRARGAMLRPRRGLIQRPNGTETWSPVWNWTTDDIWAYHALHNITPAPVYAKLAALGVEEAGQRVDVMVGIEGIRQGRLTWLRLGWPDLWTRLATELPRMREWS